MNTMVFDIETIPDVAAGRKLYDLQELSDAEVAQALYKLRRQEHAAQSEFLPHYLQKIVAISVVLESPKQFKVWSLGDKEATEAEIIQRFFDGIDKLSPNLISWNGGGFDLPVLHYRSLLHGIIAPRYWENGQSDQSFKWNNYLSRYHERHSDLMDVLSAYQPRAFAPLDDIAVMLGLPGKMGMKGDKVWDYYQQGEIEAIRNYCETDVMNTYLVYLRFCLIRGQLTKTAYEAALDRVKQFLKPATQTHWQEFLTRWDQTVA
jgi:hypothetical protein